MQERMWVTEQELDYVALNLLRLSFLISRGKRVMGICSAAGCCSTQNHKKQSPFHAVSPLKRCTTAAEVLYTTTARNVYLSGRPCRRDPDGHRYASPSETHRALRLLF